MLNDYTMSLKTNVKKKPNENLANNCFSVFHTRICKMNKRANLKQSTCVTINAISRFLSPFMFRCTEYQMYEGRAFMKPSDN